jgi:hypothetical protein
MHGCDADSARAETDRRLPRAGRRDPRAAQGNSWNSEVRRDDGHGTAVSGEDQVIKLLDAPTELRDELERIARVLMDEGEAPPLPAQQAA